ncbi:MAG: response regulator transcription factor [Anaerolineae bacterium]|nr:response regulator transcription factor [Anaerolineae bacterium]
MEEHILLVEDDESLSRMMRLQLEHAGYRVTTCRTGASALEAARQSEPDLILLDILLPDIDGWTVCEQLRKITDAPIIFSTALGSERDVVRGLELGADDYMIKPFSYKELLARVKGALHRARREATYGRVYRFGRLFVDLERRVVKVNGEHVLLTPLEYKLLAALVEEAGKVVDYETLLRRVWGEQHEGSKEYLKLYIWYLRKKLEMDPSNPQLILTEEGMGYRLVAPSEPRPSPGDNG